MPCDDRSARSIVEYEQVLGELQLVLNSADVSEVICFGEFNADPLKGQFWNYLCRFVNSNNLNFADVDNLRPDAFTFLSPVHNTSSWLDHIISSKNVQVYNIHIPYSIVLFDRFPVFVNIKTSESFIRESVIKISSGVTEFVDWTKFDRAGRNCYARAVDGALQGPDTQK